MNLSLSGAETQYQFRGAYGNEVCLTLFPRCVHPAGHVIMLPLYKEQVVLTRHRERGLEWPGGKVEAGESAVQGAIRELMEETGAIPQSIWLVGQYTVEQSVDRFRKNIYVVQVSHIDQTVQTGSDCLGYELCSPDVQPTLENGFSPIMCDPVFQHVREAVLSV
jgi:8-oxo-dGTP diphosphatase